ncbi:MAG: hypothetical protein M3270_07355 [Thermoproteota archaeon]|nr:hypothetical protein [Thermoproteota archaeon]
MEHWKLEGLCLNAMSIGIEGGVFVMVSPLPLVQYPIMGRVLAYCPEYNTIVSEI